MYSARQSTKLFWDAITRARKSCTRNRRVQIDSSAGHRSVEARQLCHREEPTSRRGKAKRVMAALTTTSDTGPDSPAETDRYKRPPRQASPWVLHAPDPPGIAPLFPPRIARPRGTRGIDPPCHSSAIQSILGALTPHGNHFSDGNSHPPHTPQFLEMITAATIAVLNQHLASIGLLPQTAATLSGESITDTDAIPPAPVLPSASPTNSQIHHLHDDRSPTSSSSQAQHRFHRGFVSKRQAEYRTLDTRRAPRVHP